MLKRSNSKTPNKASPLRSGKFYAEGILLLQISEITEIKVEKKMTSCLDFSLVFPIIWILIIISAVIKHTGREQKFGYDKNMQSGWEMFAKSSSLRNS